MTEQFNQTYLAYREMMFRVAYRIVQNEADAEDAVAEAFLRIYQNYRCIREPVSPVTRRFCAVVTERVALNALRHRRHIHPTPVEELTFLTAEDTISEEAQDIRAAFRRLPENYRTALSLAGCGLSAREVAGVMGCSVSKAEKLFSRGKEKLRTLLEGTL